MKTINLSILILVTAISIGRSQNSTIITDTVRVWGNCGMCKSVIDGSLKKVDGVKKASWDIGSDILTVSYDSSLISIMGIEQQVAASGYDTRHVKAPDEKYNNLHSCCKYDRPDYSWLEGGFSPDQNQTQAYTCPMHPEVTAAMPGSCPKCGMDLVEKK